MSTSNHLRRIALLAVAVLLVASFVAPAPAVADGGVVYTNIATDPANGLTWNRTPSPRLAIKDALAAQSPIPTTDFFRLRAEATPQKGWGNPGTAIFDYDNDGDLDIYVTNGPGTANSLFANQLADSGALTFIDQGVASGTAATAQDSAGVCAGDIDNDGDKDLYVLGTGEANILFENNGDGTFTDITATAGVAGDGRHAVGCSMGDIENDGLLDIVVANTYDSWDHRIAVFTAGSSLDPGPHYEKMEHNYLFNNVGGNVFTDVSASSGIENVSNMAGPGLTGAGFTWAIAFVDYDQDGDVDILSADNQGSAPTSRAEERGWNRLFVNDGNGNFTDETIAAGLDKFGGWMGVDFSDLNCDGNLDFFATNLGYLGAGQPSQWFLGDGNGGFTDPGQGDLVMNPFGWGLSLFDYDNDGDADIIYHGGVDIFSIITAVPGIVLNNDGACSGEFSYNAAAVPYDHQVRTVHGIAAGDLNEDGFEDIVSVSNFNFERGFYLPYVGVFFPPFGSPFDSVASFEVGTSSQINPGFTTWVDPTIVAGDLSVEINSADNGNNWAEITVAGGVGIITNASVNRDGVGAVVSFTPEGGNTSIRPIIAGSSYSSQDDLAANFGLGSASYGVAEVLWPGGVRNRLYGVWKGEEITMPEIPCSYDGNWPNKGMYMSCVSRSLAQARMAGLVAPQATFRHFLSAMMAFDEANN